MVDSVDQRYGHDNVCIHVFWVLLPARGNSAVDGMAVLTHCGIYTFTWPMHRKDDMAQVVICVTLEIENRYEKKTLHILLVIACIRIIQMFISVNINA